MLAKLREANPSYQNIKINPPWENVSQESDSELWNILIDQNHNCFEGEIDDSDQDIEGNYHAYEKEVQDFVLPLPTLLKTLKAHQFLLLTFLTSYCQIPVSFTTEPNWQALAFFIRFFLIKDFILAILPERCL